MIRHFKTIIGWGEFSKKQIVNKYKVVNNIVEPKIDILNSPHTKTMQNSKYIILNVNEKHLHKIWKNLDKNKK